MPLQTTKLLFAIADAEHARFVRPAGEDHTLHSSSRVQPEEGHAGAADHHHNHNKEKFAAWVAAQLNQCHASFDELVLVAPAHILRTIEAHLDRPARGKIAGTLDKDLTKISDHDLWPHIKQWVRPVHRQKLL
jgi:protein required for attachment to host cells